MKKICIFCLSVLLIGFVSCEGAEGPPGLPGDPAPNLPDSIPVVNIITNIGPIELFPGGQVKLEASVEPDNAAIKTLLWEFYDVKDSSIVEMGGHTMITGNSVTVTGLLPGMAKLRVTALGSGMELVIHVTIDVLSFKRRLEGIPAVFEDGKELVFELGRNETVPPLLLDFADTLPGKDIKITIKGVPGRELQLGEQGSLFTVGNRVSLNLQDINIKGISGNNTALVVVKSGAKLTMDAGAKISGNSNSSVHSETSGVPALTNNGAGVLVEASGNFIMNGGEISGNSMTGGAGSTAYLGGGGVLCAGTFTMNNGTICENEAHTGGGVLLYPEASFTMKNGEIINNTVNGYGGGVFAGSTNQIPVTGAEFIMEDGRISGNTGVEGGGVYLGTARFGMKGGDISGNTASQNGGGVYCGIDSTIHLDGGNIINNIADQYGGGVYNGNSSTFTMDKGLISGNEALAAADNKGEGGALGGGVFNYGIFTMNNGTISNNKSNGHGGGVAITTANKTFNLRGGNIFGNRAVISGGGVYARISSEFYMYGGKIFENTAATGGGVCVSSLAFFDMLDGEISGNTVEENGGGVHVNGADFYMCGGKVSDNNAKNGGGVFVSGLGVFFMLPETVSGVKTFGIISGNTASHAGGGVVLEAFDNEHGDVLGMMDGIIYGTGDALANTAPLNAVLHTLDPSGYLLAFTGTIDKVGNQNISGGLQAGNSTIRVVNGYRVNN